MASTVSIGNAKFLPKKADFAKAWSGTTDLLGSYHLHPQGDEDVKIEIIIARDFDLRRVQVPITYRPHEINPEQTLGTVMHDEQGKLWVTNALGDPAAVHAFIHTILSGGSGADSGDGDTPILKVQGTGKLSDIELKDIELTEVTRQRAVGMVTVDGRRKQFLLRIPRLLNRLKVSALGHHATALRLVADDPENPEKMLLVAEFAWLE